LTERHKEILPQLTQKYPNMEMQAELVTSSPPTASFSPQGIQVAGPGLITVSVLPANGNPVPVFAFNIQLSTSAKVPPPSLPLHACLRPGACCHHGRRCKLTSYLAQQVTVQNGRIYTDLTYLNSPVTVAVRPGLSHNKLRATDAISL
jgi:hypothetical protein